jgi:hypothetical protein
MRLTCVGGDQAILHEIIGVLDCMVFGFAHGGGGGQNKGSAFLIRASRIAYRFAIGWLWDVLLMR